ncbi:hypothetical protein ISN45_Aa01g024890 [Arabidopsis thaliana x Arabidopsis arenosa]|uniref:DUF4283 domain-containing protein n=1 Tax=Arabidopsis thaliana x Arabidopsis arenosa TaxID=1240361 RepID=A0A8T2C9D9_9BRAS|nr:hypothetical protein ISN45_Aa01g024890 [Arabidopsis thaliana x Arabidopsis arenosa]
MSSSHQTALQLTGTQLKEEDEVVILPQVDNSALIARYRLSLVGCRGRGIPLGNSRFQFDFDSERDLLEILRRRPCHFNKWSFALERWEPHVGDIFPNTMTFWIHTEDSCPLKPVTQAETSLMEKAKHNSLGKLTLGKELTLSAAPPSLKPSKNGRVPPSWWRPDLVKPPPAQEDPSSSAYHKKKAEGKQIVNDSSKHVWRRLDNSRSQNQNRNPPAKAHYSAHHESRAAPQGNHFPTSKDSGRKRRYNDTLEDPHRKPSSSKERAVTRGKGQDIPQAAKSKSAGLSHASDSQLTVSDPLISSLRAKQGVSSLALNRERPFRLNLKKRSDPNQLLPASKKHTAGDSSDTGSSAKKSLNFDSLTQDADKNAPRMTPDLPVSIMSLDKEKSWYDQTVEEEEKEARDAPLETRFSSAIQIGEDPSAIPAIPDPGTEEMDFEGDGTWEEEEEFMNEDVDDTH